MQDLSVGDRVLTLESLTGRLVYDDVIAFIHRDPDVIASFVTMTTDDGHQLTLTADHLIYAAPNNMTSSIADGGDDVVMTSRFAGSLRPGDDGVYAVAPTVLNRFGVTMVTDMSIVVRRGVFAPLTNSGNIVVDGVVTSCYASFGSHAAAHVSMAPLRFAAHARRAWLDDDKTVTHLKRDVDYYQPQGIHWYAVALRRLAELLLPYCYWYDSGGLY